jgi:ribosomal-protein-alanine N-acetyltransferase
MRKDGPLAGFCGLRLFGDPPTVEVLYGLLPAYWGQGLATEAAMAMLRFGFEELGLERIYAGADPPNTASFCVMERLGMTFSKRIVAGGLEAIYYEISRTDFQSGSAVYKISRG